MTTTEAATKIQAVFRGWSARDAYEARKEWYEEILCQVHLAPTERGRPDPVCMRFMVDVCGVDVVNKDPLYSLLTELEETGYWDHNWAPLTDDNDREHLFTWGEDVEEIGPAMDAIRVYIERFNAASKIQAAFRGATLRAPPDSSEGLELDDYGFVEGHLHWGQWIHSPVLGYRWIYIYEFQNFIRWWDASKRVWVKDTVEAIWGV